ncbi:hypothetical protein [Natrinema salifodinae]|uniref:MYM-type domain-containing protein n=1 Tax=Natrinema salifodinae TaxID=1202768 RepID=A0A1I0PPS9_9EURY|nr:hypothetical protein [Natrinema salifodinae]SEW16352.1 hypothetical protein SAMN05216285_2797 [Natrinema salifodinae]
MGTACTYCGSDVERHDPVSVTEGDDDSADRAGRFCNYACLAAYIEDEGLATGAVCEWTP